MDWLFTNLGSVIEERKAQTIEANKSGAVNKYNKPADLLQILLDAEVGSGSSRGNAVSYLTMRQSEEDHNSNYEMDLECTSNFSPEISSMCSRNYLTSKLESQQQKHVEAIGHLCEDKWPCAQDAPCEKPKTKLSLDVSSFISNIPYP